MAPYIELMGIFFRVGHNRVSLYCAMLDLILAQTRGRNPDIPLEVVAITALLPPYFHHNANICRVLRSEAHWQVRLLQCCLQVAHLLFAPLSQVRSANSVCCLGSGAAQPSEKRMQQRANTEDSPAGGSKLCRSGKDTTALTEILPVAATGKAGTAFPGTRHSREGK